MSGSQPSHHPCPPFPQTLGSVLRYLTDAKRKHSRIVWINLREEAVLEGNEQIYTLREPGLLEELIPVPAASPQQLEVSSGTCWMLWRFPATLMCDFHRL